MVTWYRQLPELARQSDARRLCSWQGGRPPLRRADATRSYGPRSPCAAVARDGFLPYHQLAGRTYVLRHALVRHDGIHGPQLTCGVNSELVLPASTKRARFADLRYYARKEGR